MATLHWVGSTDGDFSDQDNWRDPDGSAASGVPANSDTLIFDYGSVDVDAGLTTGLTGVTLIGTSGYTGRIAPGSSLSIACASVIWKGAGELRLAGNITAGKIRCRTGSPFYYASGTATLLFIDQTNYSIAAAAVVTTMRTYASFGSDLTNATKFTLVELDGGQHDTKRQGTFNVTNGARLRVLKGGSFEDGTEIGSNSVCEYLSAEDVAGGDTVVVRRAGTLDATGSSGFTWSGVLEVAPGAIVNLNTASGAVTPSTYTEYGLDEGVGAPIPAP